MNTITQMHIDAAIKSQNAFVNEWIRSGDCGDKIVDAIAQINADAFPDVGWRGIEQFEIYTESNTVFQLFNEDWIDSDFNPSGVIIGYFQPGEPGDGSGWIGTVWNPCQDHWETKVVFPTHYRKLPNPPKEGV